jgi:osmotically-inducible protein OsmY
MNTSKGLVTLAVVLSVAGWSCSSKDQDQARKTVQEIEDKTKEAASDAAAKITDKGKEIVSSTGEAITDGWITTKIKAKFGDEKTLKDSNVTVETKERVVTLKGTVRVDAAKKQAVAIANGTEGVERVVDEIVVKAK